MQRILALAFVLLLGAAPAMAAGTATLYKDPFCGCCAEYAAYLRAHGYPVAVVETESLDQVKREHGVPESLASCHTLLIEGYVVEGHVPLAAIERLLAERPAIDGIALPGMPAGSPGMSGAKAGPFTIFAFAGEAVSVFAID